MWRSNETTRCYFSQELFVLPVVVVVVAVVGGDDALVVALILSVNPE